MEHRLDLMGPAELEDLPRDPDASPGSLATERGHLPLEAMDVAARVHGLNLRIHLRQTFVNTLEQPLEATYIFPLPDRAAVTGFRLRVAERVVEGLIDERGRARASYDAAVQAGHRAAIAEEERPDVFTVRVGNLMPGQRAVVELDLVGALALDRNQATFRFPLVVAPRYIPGVPLEGAPVGDGWASDTDAVPDASRITPPVLLPGHPRPVRLRLRLELDPEGLPVSHLRSSLHAVVADGAALEPATGTGDPLAGAAAADPASAPDAGAAAAPGRRVIELRPGERLNRDFVLRWSLGDGAVHTALAVAPDPGSAAGAPSDLPGASFALTVLPPLTDAAAQRPRDVVVVLDRSGSMGGWKMVAARRAAARLIDSLGASDRFAVLAFDSRVNVPATLAADVLTPATDRNRFRAVEFLAGVEARGGTEMAAPLLRATNLLGGGYRDRERVLVLVTDGQVGNEDQVLRLLSPRLAGARVFPVGIDRAVNAGFLGRLAEMGGAGAELVESEDRLDEVMERIQRSIGTPVVTEIALAGEGLEIEPGSVSPRRLPDLLAGTPVVIRGRLRGSVNPGGSLIVRGADPSGSRWQQQVDPRLSTGGAEAALWARAMIRQLEDRYASGDRTIDRGTLASRIIDISRRHSVLSRFTAFLAVDRSEVVNPGGERHRVVQAVEPVSGWDMRGPDAELAAPGAPAPVALAARPVMMAAPDMAMQPPPAAMNSPHMPLIAGGAAASRPGAGAVVAAGQAPPRTGDLVGGHVAPPSAPEDPQAPVTARPGSRARSLLAVLQRSRQVCAARAGLHPAMLADMLVHELEPLAESLAAGATWLAAIERQRRGLVVLLESGATGGENRAAAGRAGGRPRPGHRAAGGRDRRRRGRPGPQPGRLVALSRPAWRYRPGCRRLVSRAPHDRGPDSHRARSAAPRGESASERPGLPA